MKGLLFTYLLTYGGAAASLFRPFVGLLIYVLFSILKPEALWGWSVSQDSHSSRIIAIALLLGWFARGFGDWRLGKGRGIALAFLGLWCWSVICAFMAPNAERSWYFIEAIAKILIPFIVGITILRSVGELRLLAWVILLGHGYLALEFNLYYFLDGINFVKEVGFAGMEEGSIAIGMVNASGVALFLGLAEKKWHLKVLAFCCLGLIVHIVLLTFSRGGMIGLICTGGAAFLVLPKRLINYLILAAAVVFALAATGPEVRTRFMTAFASKEERDASAQSRLDLWAGCVKVMTEHPVFGVGPYHFPLIVDTLGWKKGKEAHTLWLQIGAELGLPGLFLLVAFYGLCLVRLFPYALGRVITSDPWITSLAKMVIVSTVGFAVAAQFISLWALEVPYYITLIGAALLKLTSVTPPSQSHEIDGGLLCQ